MNYIKKLMMMLTAAAMLSVPFFTAHAEEEIEAETEPASELITSGDYAYYTKTGNYGDKVAVLEEYKGNEKEIVIPETIDGLKVEALGSHTFADNKNVTSISIPAGLEDFGIYPFYGCISVMEYKVDEKNEIYKSDADGALVGKHGLSIVAYPAGKRPTSYTVPDGTVAIGASAFAMCSDLKEVTFPDSLESIGDFAFSECTSLESVTLPDSVTELSRFAFSGCSSVKTVKLSESLTTIGDAAFFSCKALETITIPESVREIGQAAFCATGMTSVTIPASVIDIGYSAFGFETNQMDEIIPVDNFVINGYKNSIGERFCTENDITFVELEEEETESTEAEKTAKNSSKKLSPGTIVGICAAGAAAIAAVAVVIFKKSGKKSDSKNKTEDE